MFSKSKQSASSKQETTSSLAQVLVDTDRIQHNLDQFADDHELAPVIKSNAYGHGLEIVADTITDRSDVPFVCVAALREAKRLRASGYNFPVLIIGYTPVAAIIDCDLANVTFSIASIDQLKRLDDKLQQNCKFHLKVETGMHRYGVKPTNLQQTLEIIKNNSHIRLTGAFSHLSDAYKPESEFTHKQINRWNQAVETVREAVEVDYFHLAATSGHFYREDITANVERVGIGLYGITGYASQLNLKPALSLQTRIAVIKEVATGEFIGYNRTFQAKEDKRVAVLPIGYQEGMDRRLSNSGVVLVGDKQCSIVGKVSMNATMVDVTDNQNVSVGDTVNALSANPNDPNSVLTVANKIGTIPYEILVHISSELERAITTFD